MTTYKKIDWVIDRPEAVKLSFDEPLVTDNKNYPGKKNIWYGIHQSIDGEGPNGFNSTENLKLMIDLVGAKVGDTIIIEKKQGDKFAYFTVNGKTLKELQGETVTPDIDTTPPAPAPAQAEYVNVGTQKTLEERVDALEKKVKLLDDGIPF